MALTIGALYALADVLLSNTKSQFGFWAIGFLGPVNVIGVGIYRTFQACKLKYSKGYWIDKPRSNYWKLPEQERCFTLSIDFESETEDSDR